MNVSAKRFAVLVAAAVVMILAGCPLPFEYNGKGAGSHSADPSSPNMTAPITVSYSEEGGGAGTIPDGGVFASGKTTTVTLSTTSLNAVIFYTDSGLTLSDLRQAQKIDASSGSFTITRTTTPQSLDIHAVAVGPNMLPSPLVHFTVAVTPYPILTVTRITDFPIIFPDSTSEDGGTATFTITSSSPAAGDITVYLQTSGSYTTADLTGLPGPGTLTATLANGTTTLSIPITGVHNPVNADHMVTLTIQNDSNNPPSYSVGTPKVASVLIRDDLEPTLTLTEDRTSMLDGESATFTVMASLAPAADITVNISSSGHTPGKVTVPSVVSLPAGTTSATFQVSSPSEVGYQVQNPQVSIGSGTGYSIGSPSAQSLLITDNIQGITYDGVWGFTTDTGSGVGTGASWNLTGNVTLGGGGLTFGGTYPTDDATVPLSAGGIAFNNNSFTLAVKFTLSDLGAVHPIIAAGTSFRWLIVQSDTTGALSLELNNHTVHLPLGMTIAAGTSYTLVLNIDVAGLKAKAWLDGVPAPLTLPPGFAWNGYPPGDEHLTATDFSTGHTFRGTWYWVFAVNGLLSYDTVVSIAASSGL